MEISNFIKYKILSYLNPYEIYKLSCVNGLLNSEVLRMIFNDIYCFGGEYSYIKYLEIVSDLNSICDVVIGVSQTTKIFKYNICFYRKTRTTIGPHLYIDYYKFKEILYNGLVGLFLWKGKPLVQESYHNQLITIARTIIPYNVDIDHFDILDYILHITELNLNLIKRSISKITNKYNSIFNSADVFMFIICYINQILNGYNKYLYLESSPKKFIQYINSLPFNPKILKRSDNVALTNIGPIVLNYDINIELYHRNYDICLNITINDIYIKYPDIINILIQIGKLYNNITINSIKSGYIDDYYKGIIDRQIAISINYIVKGYFKKLGIIGICNSSSNIKRISDYSIQINPQNNISSIVTYTDKCDFHHPRSIL